MHPSSALIAWLASVLAIQFLAYPGLGLLALGLLLSSSVALLSPWRVYVRRARWLLLTLWLILAFNTPGEAYREIAWAPTYEGMGEANLQAVRLVLMLGCLAWLFDRLGRDGLVAALWGLTQPLQRLGLDTCRLAVRLSLVLSNLQAQPQKGDWRKMLAGDAAFAGGPEVLHFALPRWRPMDSLCAATAGLLLLGAIAL